jgi:pimeloyl-ACP methyl ester carboxylesterase
LVLGGLAACMCVGLGAQTAAGEALGRPASAGLQRQGLNSPSGAPAPNASAATCQVAPGGLCGRVLVPLDRHDPKGPRIGVAYVLFRHTDTAHPALGTILVTQGGPGISVINNLQNAYLSMFGPLLNRRDLVLIDQRGVGRSRTIRCPEVQNGSEEPYEAVAGCGARLGESSDLYGSAEVARDIDAVRAALGVSQFDFYGGSYAGVDIQAYAARFPDRLRSAVLDSSMRIDPSDPWNSAEPAQIVKAVELLCERSALCSGANPNPADELAWLIRRLRAEPVEGIGLDADGVVHHVRVTEATLGAMLQLEDGGLLVQGEVPAAARALRSDDSTPLLRLAAENDFPSFSGGPRNPTVLSVGDAFARFCTDGRFQWDKAGSPAQRRAQFDQARAALSPDRFDPFSLDAWVVPAPLGYLPDLCIGWPAPTHDPEPPVPDGTVVPGLPVLLLTGDLDLTVAPGVSTRLTGMFPNASVVSIAESGHHTSFGFQSACAQRLVVRFVAARQPGNTSCAAHPTLIVPARDSFPRRASAQGPELAAKPPPRTEGDSLRERVAAIAAATVTDAFRRSFIQTQPDGVGLRGGAFHFEEASAGPTIHLSGARFAEDVAVTGEATVVEGVTLEASLSVAGAAQGTLHVHGVWLVPGAGRLKISGSLDGHQITTSVPAT